MSPIGSRISDGAGMVEDRLGSKEKTGGAQSASYYPYGELKTGTASQFATYLRNGTTGLDYAQQRWYSSQVMRFTSPDPWGGSAALANPQSWNQYRYANDDPVNWTDPTGLDPSVDGPATFSITAWLELGSDPPPGVIVPEWALALIVGDALDMQFRRTLKPEREPLLIGPRGGRWKLSGKPFGYNGAYNDLAKPDCYKLFGFKSAEAAQTAFNQIVFQAAYLGVPAVQSVEGGWQVVPKSKPPAQTDNNTVTLNWSYN